MKKIKEPSHLEFAMYYEQYVQKVDKNISVLDQLKDNSKEISKLLLSLSEKELITPYEPGKWCIKDIIMHLIDMERVFIYRGMRFARNDKTPLLFFDENVFAANANAASINLKKLIKEYLATRNATLAFFNNLNAEQMRRQGMASSYTMSVRACPWIICGHELHHWNIIKARYLKK